MRISPRALLGILILAAAIEACTGAGNSTPPNLNGTVTSSGTSVTLGNSTSLQPFPATNGYAGSIIYPTGSGTVNGNVTADPPASLPALLSTARTSEAKTQATGNTPLFYVAYTGSAKLSGIPGVSFTLPAATTGVTYYEAEWNGSAWLTLTAGGNANISGTTVTFNAGATPVTLTSGTPLYFAIYSGSKISLGAAPTATPSGGTGPTGPNAIADPGFESGTYTPLVSPATATVTTTGWSACSISKTGPSPQPYAQSTYTPTSGSTPAATIVQAGSTISNTASPPPVQPNVVHGGSYAALLGGDLYPYPIADYRYSGLCEQVTVPANPVLSMYVLGTGASAVTASEFQFVVDVLDTSNGFKGNLYSEFTTSDTAYRQITSGSTANFTSLSAYAGQTVQLFVGIWTTGGSSHLGAYYFVDDLSLSGG